MRMGLTHLTVTVAAVLGALTVGGIGVTTVAEQSLRHADRLETRSMQTLVVANALEKSVLDLETGLRGYLLTAQPRFLQPYRLALAAYPSEASSLMTLTADTPAQRASVARITTAIGAYVRDYAQLRIREARAGHLAAARSAVATGAGKARVDAIRAQFATLTQVDIRATTATARAARSQAALALALGIASMALTAASIVVITFAVRRTIAVPLRRLAAAAGRVSLGELSVRVPARGVAEVGELAGGFNAMTDSLSLQRTELEAQKAELEAQQVQLEESFVALEERKGHIELLQRFGARLAAVSGVSEVSSAALKEFGDAAQAEAGALYLFDERTGTFPLTARRGTATEDVPGVVRVGDGLAGLALAERRPVTVSQVQATVQTVGVGGRRTAMQELHLPLRHGDRLVGVMSVGRFRDEPFTGPDLEVLADLAHHAAVACAEAQSQRAVERVAAELAAVLAATDEGFCVIDKDGLVTMANRAALDQTGYARAQRPRHPAP
jgi:CHASE3 domain sensor protein/putative methionine-R-sulfoxide reductase with GAF domain